MHPHLLTDSDNLAALTASARQVALDFLNNLQDVPAAKTPAKSHDENDDVEGVGGANALELFTHKWLPHLSGSAGPRYLGFVTGGATPASLIGDWLTSSLDQNPTSNWDSEAPNLERETVRAIAKWFSLPSHDGVFVTGATMSNFVGLAIGREWVGRHRGVHVGEEGLAALGPVKILSGKPHSSVYKAASMLGLGRSAVTVVPVLPSREAVDVVALEAVIAAESERGCIVVANFGTVNSGDFDDLRAILALKSKYNFWLHVDGAFGAFAALDPRLAAQVEGMDEADSICIDCHKWMNVPYDSALQFTRRRDLQVAVFQNAAAYLGQVGSNPNFVHLTPENSRRWRALAAWFAVKAYGKDGHADIVQRNVSCARELGDRMLSEFSSKVELLAPVRLNVVLFAVVGRTSETEVLDFLRNLTDTGEVFMTPTVYEGRWAIRAAFSNWRTTTGDVARVFHALASVL